MRGNLLISALCCFLFLTPKVMAQVPDSCTFVQSDSIITIEMESANLNGGFWVMQNDDDYAGFLGSGYIQYIGGDATGIPGRSQLSYTFKVKEAGRHSFKMRAYRDEYHDNDVWVRFPHGGVVTKIGNDSTGTHGNNWFKAVIGARDEWYGFVKTQLLGTSWGEAFHDIYVDFPAPGVYTVEFAGRATGFRIDRFMLYYKKSSYYGMNLNNPESEKINCAPYYMGDAPYVAIPLEDQEAIATISWSYTFPENAFGESSPGYTAFQPNMAALPSWMTFNPATRTFSGTPTYEDGGKYIIMVRAHDNGKYAVDAFNLTVIGNRPPEIATALEDTIAFTGETFVYDIAPNFTDADGHILTFTAASVNGAALPEWLAFNGTVFTGNPETAHEGNDTIYVTANDNHGGEVTESFIVYVKPSSVQSITKGMKRMAATVYPNPAEDKLHIKLEERGAGQLTVADNLGKVYYTEEINSYANEITVNIMSLGLQPGMYTLRFRSEEKGTEYNGLFLKK